MELDTSIRRRRALVRVGVATAASLALVLTGCTPGGSSTGGGDDAVLTIGAYDGSINDSLDPLRMERSFQILAASTIYESLVDVNEQLQLVPRLAESFETTDEGSTWTFVLRPDVTFHDGSPLTADDVVASIGRALDPDEGSGNSLAGQLAAILTPDGITAVDDGTVEFALETPYVFFPNAMATRFARIYPAGTTDWDAPIGTGPFVFESFTPGEEFVAARYDDYWGGAAAVGQVEIVNYADEATRLSAFIDGDLDVMFDMSSTAAADIAGDDGFGLLEQLNAKWIPLGIDSTVAPFDNPDLILAIKSAIDRQAVIDTALGGFGTIGYDTPIPAEDANFGGLPEPEFNLDTAREHLADAGYPDGVTLPTLTVLDIPQAISVALVLQQQLAEVGITFEIERESSATFWDNSWLIKPFFSNDYLRRTPDEILKLVSVSDGPWNISKRVDPEVDAAVAAAAATTDPAEQKEQYTIAQELLAARDTVIVPAHVSRLSGVVAGLDGIETNPVYFLDLRGAGFTE